ncbi:CBF-domain-containing protein [Meredithblackwellia eburnea MCA 4105]
MGSGSGLGNGLETLKKINSLAAVLPPSAPISSDLNPLADFVQLFAQLNSNSNSNTDESSRQSVHTAFHSLKSTFQALVNAGRIHGTSAVSNNDKQDKARLKVKQWLVSNYNDFVSNAAQLAVSHWDNGVKASILTGLMSLIRTESAFLTSLHPQKQHQWPHESFRLIVRQLLLPSHSNNQLLPDEAKVEWLKYWNKYDDIRYYFFKESAAYTSSYQASSPNSQLQSLANNILAHLESLTSMPTSSSELDEWWSSAPKALTGPDSRTVASGRKRRKLNSRLPKVSAEDEEDDGSTGIFDSSSEEESDAEATTSSKLKLSAKARRRLLPPLLQLSAHRKVFQECWMSLLQLPLSEAEMKRVLVILHRSVLPHFVEARRLGDWLSDCTTAGGTIAILALNGLFTLMTKHNFEFPDFYTRLYGLLDREVLHVRYRPRFFRLLEIFMSSSHLPAAIVASFIKRLARLSLAAPPPAIVTVVPFVYNLLKKHTKCLGMIHRPPAGVKKGEVNVEVQLACDPFKSAETDPLQTLALDSSLWELSTLRNHYLSSVSGLAKVFAEVLSKERYEMEDFLDHSYGTMIQTELTRVIKNAPALAAVPQRQPIGNSFFPSCGEDEADERGAIDVVSELWTF